MRRPIPPYTRLMSTDVPPAPPSLDERLFARRINWNHFYLFCEIVRAGGISEAARRLNRRQPTVSAALKQLEEQLGTPLLARTSQGVELLPAGRALYDLSERMMQIVRAVPHEVAKAAGAVHGTIHISMISSVVSSALDATLTRFHRDLPGVEVRLDVAPWRSVVRAVETGDAEIGIACDSAPMADLHYEPLVKEIQQLYCARSHPLAGRSFTRPSELAGEDFIMTGLDEPLELELFRRRYGLGERPGGFAENLPEVKRLIELGIGIGFLPTCVAETAEGKTDNKLWPLLPPGMVPAYHVYLITRRDAARRTPAEIFLTMLQDALKEG